MKKVTQNERVLNYLRSGEILTNILAKDRLGVLNPTARISELRGDGHKINTKMIKVKDRWQCNTRVAEWSLISDEI